MKNILMLAAIAMCGLTCAGPALGQACGVSRYTFTVYVRNGTAAARNVRYRVFPLTRVDGKTDTTWLRETLAPEHDHKDFATWSYRRPPLRVDLNAARSFVRTYDPKLYKPQDTTYGSKNELAGVFKNSTATFSTVETDDTPYLLEITADGFQSVYILAPIMGGCRQHDDVVLKKRGETVQVWN
ncbi:MAG TPA: hypothetical protein VNA17_11095 [Pyrinomonadaceae bacterium]|nr:hypothetical protein [Pyrinomonadaceae bacterium]